MTPLAVGFVLVALVDLVAPLAAVVWLIRRNARARTSRTTEGVFWGLAGGYTLLVALVAALGVASVVSFAAEGVIAVTVLAMPLGVVPLVVHTTLLHLLFDDAAWAEVGYLPVMTAYCVGMVLWAFLNAAGLRALISIARRARRA